MSEIATPAAVLSILVKAQGVQAASAQLGALDKSARRAATGIDTAEKHAKRGSASLAKLGSVAKVGAAAGFAGLAVGVKFAVSEFREAQKVGAQTNAVLKSTGNAAKVSAKGVSDLANAISKKVGIDDEAIQSGENLLLTFTKIRNETGKGNDIFNRATQTITDMSVALGQDMKSSAIQVGKALNDPIKGMTALSRVGVSFTEGQKKQVAAMVKAGDTLGAQKLILRELTKEFGGSAAAQATAVDHLKVTLGNLAENVGAKLVPVMDKAATALDKVIGEMQTGTGSGGAFTRTMAHMGDVFLGFISTGIDAEGMLARLLGKLIPGRDRFDKFAEEAQVASDKINRLRESLRRTAEGMDSVSGNVSGLGVKLNKLGDPVGNTGVKFGKLQLVVEDFDDTLRTKMSSGARSVGHVGDAVDSVRTKFADLQDFIDGLDVGSLKNIGGKKIKAIGDGLGSLRSAGPSAGKGSAALMGANSSLAPFARVGAGFGLHVSSGRRPGSITSSGNPSYHGSGEAIDMAGDPRGMIGFFNAMKSKYGGRLAELIYTPGGAGIKNGQPFTYTGQVAKDHFDHVHVAFDTGKPGVGDGFGRRLRGHLMGDGYGKTGLEALWKRAGGPAGSANLAAAVALAESGGQSTASHRNTDGSIDRGLWQINSVHGSQSTFNPLANARSAVAISGHGRNWAPWVTFKTGAYKRFLGSAAAAKKTAGKAGRKIKSAGGGKTTVEGHHSTGLTDYQAAELEADRQHGIDARAADAAGTTGGDTGDGGDPNQPLIDALAAEAAARQAQTDAINSLKAEILAQTNFAKQVVATENFQLTKGIADILSGHIVGYGLAGRQLLPGSGALGRY